MIVTDLNIFHKKKESKISFKRTVTEVDLIWKRSLFHHQALNRITADTETDEAITHLVFQSITKLNINSCKIAFLSSFR